MAILKLSLNTKSIVKSQEMKKHNLLENQNSRDKPSLEKSINFHEIQRNFYDSENDNNEKNQLTVTQTNIATNINEGNRLCNNDSKIENGINESTVKSNQGKLAFILGGSMVKDVDGYLLIGSINRKFIVEVRPFSSAKTVDKEDFTKSTKWDFNPDLHILHVRTNDFSLDDTPEVISSRIIDMLSLRWQEKTK